MDHRTGRAWVETTGEWQEAKWRPQCWQSQVEPQELVEPGGDHEGRPHGSGSSEHRTGGVGI